MLSYLIWHHSAKAKGVGTVEDMERLVMTRLRGVYLVPFVDFDYICGFRKEEPLNSHYGHSKENPTLYGSGYRIPIAMLTDFRYREEVQLGEWLSDPLSDLGKKTPVCPE